MKAENIRISWCSRLKDDLPLSEVSIPGSHDSAAHQAAWYTSCFACIWKTQDMNLAEQLESGIRYFDIRIKFVPGRPLLLVHDVVELGLLDRAFDDFMSFLAKYPNEFIIMQAQRENSEQCEAACSHRFAQYIQKKQLPILLSKQIPKVGEIRGKIWLIETNFKLGSFGINTWTDGRAIRHDRYFLQNMWNGPREQKMQLALLILRDASHPGLRINFMNQTRAWHSRQSLSHFYNEQVRQVLPTLTRSAGIVVMDYPSQALIEELLLLNFRS